MSDRTTDAAWHNPADTPAGATTRFAVELAAWVLVPWAVARAVGWIAGLVVLVVIVAATGTFNAAGDKRHEGVTVPGPVRLALEAALGVGATVAAGYLWGQAGAVPLAALVVVAAVAGRRRSAWLLQGAAAGGAGA
jgi:hypothetical protein